MKMKQSSGKPKISIVLPTYNRAAILRRTLAHLAAQDMKPEELELIVVDDGSPDHTGRVVEEMAAGIPFQVTYLRHENEGPGYSQNRGIREARAKLVLLLADDIFLAPSAVRAHVDYHEQHPEPGVVLSGKIIQSPELNQSAFLRNWNPFRFNELDGLTKLRPWRFGAANLSLKRDFLLANGMFLEHTGRGGAAAMEDLELGYRLEKHGMELHYSTKAWGHHYHMATLDQAIDRWYERGLNYDEFRRYATHPELTVYFHMLTRKTFKEYAGVLMGENAFQGKEKSFTWHIVRHAGRLITLNRITAGLVWRPLLNLAEKNRFVESLMTPNVYRAFLYYHFLRGVGDARKIYRSTHQSPK